MTNNVLTKYSNEVGGSKHIFTDAVETLIGGGQFERASLPMDKQVLHAGTPILVDEITRLATVHYAFEVMDVAGAVIKVKKNGGSTVAKVGMFVMEAPATVATTGTAATIDEIDSTNADYDTLTLSAAITGLATGEMIVEANQTGAGAVVKVIPNAIQVADLYMKEGSYDWSFAAGYHTKGIVYERRIAPIIPCIKDELRKVCFFRFSQSK